MGRKVAGEWGRSWIECNGRTPPASLQARLALLWHADCAPPSQPTSCPPARLATSCPTPLQPELSRVLFPTFAHAYLNLVSLGAQAEAQALMGAHRQRFLDAAVGGSSLRMQVGMGVGWGRGAPGATGAPRKQPWIPWDSDSNRWPEGCWALCANLQWRLFVPVCQGVACAAPPSLCLLAILLSPSN